MDNRKMPKVQPPIKMDAALDILMSVSSHISTPDDWYGMTHFYFDVERDITYKSRWRLKTKEGAMARQRRETIKYLKDLRDQIDDVLAKIDTAQPDEHDTISVASRAYLPHP